MTDYAELGKRLVACKHFRWLAGMLVSNGARIVTVNEDTPLRFSGFYPDLSDAATVGCLLVLVRAATNDPGIYARLFTAEGRWCICSADWMGKSVLVNGKYLWGDTEAEALVVALEAAP
jgi:hypothetical protein